MLIGIDASRAFVARPTGTERYSREIIRSLLEIDKKNTYVLYTRPDVSSAGDASRGLRRVPVANRASRVSEDIGRGCAAAGPAEILPIPFPFLWTQAGLALETWLRPPDVLFIPAHTLPILRRPGVKTVVTIHDLGAEWLPEYHQFPQKKYLTWSTEYALAHADAVIAVSEATKKDAVKRYRSIIKDINLITVIPEGVDTKVFHPRPEEEVMQMFEKYGLFCERSTRDVHPWVQAKITCEASKRRNHGCKAVEASLKKFPKYFLFVGTIQPRKNLVRLIEAFSKVCHSGGSAATDRISRLVLIGKRGWLSDEIYAAAQKVNDESNNDYIRFLDNVPTEDLPAFYSGATALVFPSLFEGFGLPILEAMACGCPVMTSNVSSMPEVGGNAVEYVDPYNIEDIKQKIQLLANDEERCQELRKKGLERAKKFTWEAAARKTLAVLEGVVSA
ncbi:MAG: glycosyltransferase family 1 protein [bacterium]|nr:glycosyltransferase family 1 protein [bacterium]